MCVGRNGEQERIHGVDKMDTEGNSQEEMTEDLEGGGLEVC